MPLFVLLATLLPTAWGQALRTSNGSLIMEIAGASFTFSSSSSLSCASQALQTSFATQSDVNAAIANAAQFTQSQISLSALTTAASFAVVTTGLSARVDSVSNSVNSSINLIASVLGGQQANWQISTNTVLSSLSTAIASTALATAQQFTSTQLSTTAQLASLTQSQSNSFSMAMAAVLATQASQATINNAVSQVCPNKIGGFEHRFFFSLSSWMLCVSCLDTR